MPTKGPREWGNRAKEARDRSAEDTQAILKEARRLLVMSSRGTIKRDELALSVALIIDKSQNVLRHLEGQGAQTRPE